MNLYKIKNWDRLYENNRTRELKQLAFVLVPNKHDGDGFRAIMHHEDGLKIFGAWVLILQVASKCEPRGTLIRTNKLPHTERTIARMTGAQEGDIYIAIQFLASSEVEWLCVEDVTIPQEGAGIPQEGAGIPQEGAGKCDSFCSVLSSSVQSSSGQALGVEPDGFLRFWQAWPSHRRKKARPKCLKAWTKLGLESRADEIIGKVRAWAVSDDWTKNGGQFIPGPLPWLNDESYDAPAPTQAEDDDPLASLRRPLTPEQRAIGMEAANGQN